MFTCPTHPNTNSKKKRQQNKKKAPFQHLTLLQPGNPWVPARSASEKSWRYPRRSYRPAAARRGTPRTNSAGSSAWIPAWLSAAFDTIWFLPGHGVPKKVGHPKNEPKLMSLISDCSSAQFFGAVKFACPLSWSKQNTGAPVLPLHRRHQGC